MSGQVPDELVEHAPGLLVMGQVMGQDPDGRRRGRAATIACAS